MPHPPEHVEQDGVHYKHRPIAAIRSESAADAARALPHRSPIDTDVRFEEVMRVLEQTGRYLFGGKLHRGSLVKRRVAGGAWSYTVHLALPGGRVMLADEEAPFYVVADPPRAVGAARRQRHPVLRPSRRTVTFTCEVGDMVMRFRAPNSREDFNYNTRKSPISTFVLDLDISKFAAPPSDYVLFVHEDSRERMKDAVMWNIHMNTFVAGEVSRIKSFVKMFTPRQHDGTFGDSAEYAQREVGYPEAPVVFTAHAVAGITLHPSPGWNKECMFNTHELKTFVLDPAVPPPVHKRPARLPGAPRNIPATSPPHTHGGSAHHQWDSELHPRRVRDRSGRTFIRVPHQQTDHISKHFDHTDFLRFHYHGRLVEGNVENWGPPEGPDPQLDKFVVYLKGDDTPRQVAIDEAPLYVEYSMDTMHVPEVAAIKTALEHETNPRVEAQYYTRDEMKQLDLHGSAKRTIMKHPTTMLDQKTNTLYRKFKNNSPFHPAFNPDARFLYYDDSQDGPSGELGTALYSALGPPSAAGTLMLYADEKDHAFPVNEGFAPAYFPAFTIAPSRSRPAGGKMVTPGFENVQYYTPGEGARMAGYPEMKRPTTIRDHDGTLYRKWAPQLTVAETPWAWHDKARYLYYGDGYHSHGQPKTMLHKGKYDSASRTVNLPRRRANLSAHARARRGEEEEERVGVEDAPLYVPVDAVLM